MRRGEIAKKGLYLGTGAGLVFFALTGLLSGSFIGGVIGLKVAGGIFGTPVGVQLLPRLIVAASMVLGVMAAGFIFVGGGAIWGWLAGHVIDALRHSKGEITDLAVEHKKSI